MINWLKKRIQENYQNHNKDNKNVGDSGVFHSGAASTGLIVDDDKHSKSDNSSDFGFDSGGSDGGGGGD